MIDVHEAISMVKKKYPDKKMRGEPGIVGNMYAFNFVDKQLPEEEARWDNTLIGVDRNSGKISEHSFFDKYIIENYQSIEE